MEKKVVHEVRLSKPLMAVAIIAAFGLLAIGLKPLIEATPAFAHMYDFTQSDKVHKIAICGTDDGDLIGTLHCLRMSRKGILNVSQ